MLERERKVRLLLETMDDYLPGPSTIKSQDLPGPAPSTRRPCDDCKGTGRTTRGLCLVCDGAGRRRATLREQRQDGWDEYVEAPVAEAVVPQLSAGVDRAAEIRRLDSSIARIQRTLDAKDGKMVEEAFPWEAARAAYERAGSYAELRRCLAELRLKAPDVYAAIRRLYTLALSPPTRHEKALEAVGVSFLAQAMRHVNVPPWIEQEAGESRNETIETLAAEGMTAGQIGRRLRIPKEKVRQVLRKAEQKARRPLDPVESVVSGSP